MKTYEIVIIGGGSAGIAAAIEAYHNGAKSILLLERDQELGGILLQCIHNGFGLHRFKEELSGPAYAEKWITMLNETDVNVKTSSMVIHLSVSKERKDALGRALKEIVYVNKKEGYVSIAAQSVILAMGCLERTRGAIAIPGFRPSGVYTAGTAQKYLNMDGYLVGKRVFILGSGDIGLIMARRMTLEGAKVLGVAELMPYSNGLPRNMKQCLEDFEIPLYLSHTITDIRGRERVEGITIAQVDDKLSPIPGTEKEFEVDTLLLSVGLIPENALSEEAGVPLMKKTRGPICDESKQTEIEGIFACGNVLHVHDLVDFVSMEGEQAGKNAARYVRGELKSKKGFSVCPSEGISYILPAYVNPENVEDSLELLFRVNRNERNVSIQICMGDKLVKTIKRPHIAPSEMEKVVLKKDELLSLQDKSSFSKNELTVRVVSEVKT